MYIPKEFAVGDTAEILAFMKQHSFAVLVSTVADRYWGTHLPLLLHQNAAGGYYLLGHLSKANPQWQHFREQEKVLAIFSGPHAYVSSAWYAQESVPTWNYMAVHVYGTLQLVSG